jgi:hypothetical protein
MALNPAGHPIDPGRVAHHSLGSDDMTVAAVRLREADVILTDVAFGLASKNKEGWLDRVAVLIREAQIIVDIERGALEVT